MNLKELLKPTAGKIILLIVLMVGEFLLFEPFRVLDAIIIVGFPLPFLPLGNGFYIADTLGAVMPQAPIFSVVNFAIDVIFWYAISSIVIFTLTEFKRRYK